MKRVTLIGGAGFGGAGAAKALLARGHLVRVIDIVAPNEADSLRAEIDSGELAYVWKSAHDIGPADIADTDVLCHFAAQADVPMSFPSPTWTAWQNVMGLLPVLEAARHVSLEKIILPSTGNVVGRPEYLPIDELHPVVPHNPYAASKAAQELYAQAYARCYGLPVVVFRNGVVYGPGMRRDIFIYVWLKNIVTGQACKLEGGDQTRDPCYVSDTVNAWVAGIEADPAEVVGRTFQVSRGREYAVEEILDRCLEVGERAGYARPTVTRTEYRPGEQGQREWFAIDRARAVLGYDPTVDLEEGLRLTLASVEREAANLAR